MNEGDLAGAEKMLELAIELCEKNLQQTPEDRPLIITYPVILQNRATVRLKEGRMQDALRDFNQSVKVAKPGDRGPRRIARGEFHLQLGDYRQAMQELNDALEDLTVESSPRVWTMVLMNGAKLAAKCSTAASSDQVLNADGNAALAEKYAATAVNLLNQALEKGLADTESLRTIPEFESLREREDFKSLRK